MMKKRWMCALLAAGMLANVLSGCGQSSFTETQGTTDAGTKPQAQEGDSVPMGRYVEGEIELPGESREDICDIIQNENGSLELYTKKDNEIRRYTFEGQEWKREEKSLMEGLEVPYNFHIIVGGDGSRYALYPLSNGYRFCLMKLAEDGEPQELLEELLSEKRDNGSYKHYPDFAGVTPEGNVLLSLRDMTRVYTPEGEPVMEVPQTSCSSDWKTASYLKGNEYLTIGENGYIRYDVSETKGQLMEEIAYQQGNSDQYAAVAPDKDGGFFMANPKGIHHIGQGGSIWETVVDGELNSLSQPSAYITKLFVGSEDDFYVWINSAGTDMIKHYTYDPEIPSVPGKTLTVYGLDLGSAETVRQAASMFQLAHPDVRVELIDGQTEAGSTTVSDTIRALNTELLSGNGADVLVLDGLPADAYMEKGVLLDLRETLKPMLEANEFGENITGPFTAADGGIYRIPARMTLMTVYGDPEALASLKTMEDVRRYQSDPSHLPLRPRTTYENLLRHVFMLYSWEIVDGESGMLRPGKVAELLETVKVLGEANDSKASFDESDEGEIHFYYNTSMKSQGLPGDESIELQRGDICAAIESVDGMYSLMLPLAVADQLGCEMEGYNASYMPSQMLGINRSGGQIGLAEEFVRFVLGDQVQDSDLMDGLPVNKKAAAHWTSEDWGNPELSIAVSGGDGYSLAGTFPTTEQRRHIFALAEAADQPILADRVLLDIIMAETKGFFDGTLSLEQAAQNAESKANLYFAE